MIRKITPVLAVFLIVMTSVFGNAQQNANLPAEAPTKKLRFFNLDLHISVIADVKNILETMGHEVVNWSISGHTFVFGKKRDQVDVVNENTWQGLDRQMCDRFYERYKDYLNQFDGFIVTHNASFALLYEKFNKPIIVVNSTRYENPFTRSPEKWTWLNAYLKEGVKKNKIFLISNNKGDQRYLKHYTGLDSEHIPSLCLYTQGQYTGKTDGFILHSLEGSNFLNVMKKTLKNPNLIQNDKLPYAYKWQTLYDFKGVIHLPYNISTMSMFEQYSANMPLFVPHKNLLYTLKKQHLSGALNQLSWFVVHNVPTPTLQGDPNNVESESTLNFWLNAADFYDQENMPYIQHFESFAQLESMLQTVDLKQISTQMNQHNVERKAKAFKQWEAILQKVILSCEQP
jgi:hypothetical protein